MNQNHLKSALLALSEKMKFLEGVDSEKQVLKDQLQESETARGELRLNIIENGKRVKEDKEKTSKLHEMLITENESLSQ